MKFLKEEKKQTKKHTKAINSISENFDHHFGFGIFNDLSGWLNQLRSRFLTLAL